MSLCDRIKEVRRYGPHTALVEFDDRRAVIYEKGEHSVYEKDPRDHDRPDSHMHYPRVCVGTEKHTLFAVLTPTMRIRDIESGGRYITENGGYPFSQETQTHLGEYASKFLLEQKETARRERMRLVYDGIVEPLDIADTVRHDWKSIAGAALFGFGWPVILPAYLIEKKRKEAQGVDIDPSGDLSIAVAFGFVGIGIAEELLRNPSIHEHKIRNRGHLSTESSETRTGVVFGLDETPERFNTMTLLLPGGTLIYKDGMYPHRPEARAEARWFVDADPALLQEAKSVMQEEKDEAAKRQAFVRDVENSHTAILERIGF